MRKAGCDLNAEHLAAAESHGGFHHGYRGVADQETGFQFLGNSGLVLTTFWVTVGTLATLNRVLVLKWKHSCSCPLVTSKPRCITQL